MKEVFEKIVNKLIDKQNLCYERMVFSHSKQDAKACRNIGKGLEYAIEIVNEVEKEVDGKKPKYVRYGTYEQVAWERDIAIQQLNELGYEFGQKIDGKDTNVPSNDWIPVKERLPEEDGIYLISQDGTVVSARCYAGCGVFVDDVEEYFHYNPQAWKPLPEPYNPDKLHQEAEG